MPKGIFFKAFEQLGYSADAAKLYACGKNARALLVRGAFFRGLWDLVIDEDANVDGEPTWIEQWLRWPRSTKKKPTGVAAAIQRMLDAGVDPDDLTDVVRAMQWDVIFNLAMLLEGEQVAELREKIPELPDFTLRVFDSQLGPRGKVKPLTVLDDLHASLGELDPAGRNGEPRTRRAKRRGKKRARS